MGGGRPEGAGFDQPGVSTPGTRIPSDPQAPKGRPSLSNLQVGPTGLINLFIQRTRGSHPGLIKCRPFRARPRPAAPAPVEDIEGFRRTGTMVGVRVPSRRPPVGAAAAPGAGPPRSERGQRPHLSALRLLRGKVSKRWAERNERKTRMSSLFEARSMPDKNHASARAASLGRGYTA